MDDPTDPAAADDARGAPARGHPPAPPNMLSRNIAERPSCYDAFCLPSGSAAWLVPSTAHTGGAWAIVDGFATPEECAALIAASGGLGELDEPSAQYRMPPTNADYRSADAAGLQIPAARDLARRAAIFTGVPANDDGDCVMLARTARLPPRGDEPDAARDDDDDDAASVDSEGFLLAPETEQNADSKNDKKNAEELELGALINVHHDHNRDERRTCTVFVYLSDVGPPDAGGETFFPCVGSGSASVSVRASSQEKKDGADEADAPGASADARPSDPVADALASLGARGVHVAWAGAEDEREAAAVALCAERFEALKKRASSEASAAPPGAPPGVVFAGDGAPGMIVTPRAGRAVVFWNGASAASCPEAWHAPARVRGDAPKWLVTLFKAGEPAAAPEGREAEAAAKAAAAARDAGADDTRPADRSVPESVPESDPEAEAEAALAALGAAAAASGKPSAPHPAAALAAFQSLASGVSGASGPGPGAGARDAEALNPMLRLPTHVVSKHKSLCPVDGCTHPRKVPSGNNRLPLTCPAHAGALSVPYGGVPSRECQACRTFHDLGAFDRDNKTCETRLLRKKLRYRARTLATPSEEGDRMNAEPKPEKPEPGASAADGAVATKKGEKRDAGDGVVGGDRGAWAAVAAVTKGELGDGADQGGVPRTAAAGRKRGAFELDAETAAVLGGAGPGPGPGGPGANKPAAPRRGRPPGSKNKNWTSKIVAASYLEQQRMDALRRRAEGTLAANAAALASLPPHLRAAYVGDQTLKANPFGYAAVAASAADAAAAFADRHGAAARAATRAESHGPSAPELAGVGLGNVSSHHAILAAQVQAHARAEEQLRSAHAAVPAGASPFGALGLLGALAPSGAQQPGASEAAANGLGAAALARALAGGAGDAHSRGGLPSFGDLNALSTLSTLSTLNSLNALKAATGVGLGDPSASGASASAALARDAALGGNFENSATARVNHLMHIASAMDPAGAAALRGAAERSGALGEPGIQEGGAPNQEGGCSIS